MDYLFILYPQKKLNNHKTFHNLLFYPTYRISVEEFNDTGVTNGSLSFELNDKSSTVIPIVIYHGKQ